MLFYTNSTKHLAATLRVRKGKCNISRFSDQEISVQIRENVKNKNVWVLASTQAPADNVLELLFLLDALKRQQARVNLVMPYFGYARQDRLIKGEPLSSKLLYDLLNNYARKKVVIDMHNPRVKKFFKWDNLVPYDLYVPIVKKCDLIIAPDRGALPVAKLLGKRSKIPYISMEKTRPRIEVAKITKVNGKVRGKNVVIVDDMISTGGTIIEATKKLKQLGANSISIIATHGLFTKGALKKLEKSPIKKIYVTNTLPQQKSKKLRVLDITPILKRIIS